VHALVKHFEASLTLAVAAAELGLTADELSEKLRNSSDRRSLGQIINKGGTVKRDAFRADFADLARDLGVVGAPLPSGTSAGGATTSGGDLSGSGDFVCFFEAVGPSVNPGVETVIQAKGFSAASSDEATTKAAENCASIIDGLAGYKCRKAAAPCKRAG
jgi:hypothetical protein